jgi:hypothetical protein
MLPSKGEEGFWVGLLKDGPVIAEQTAVGMDIQRPRTAFISSHAGPSRIYCS